MFSKHVDRSELNPGDHILVRRFGLAYSHHGVYLGEERVVHYAECRGLSKKLHSRIVETHLDDFLRGGELRRRDHPNPSPRHRTLRRAKRLLSRRRYSLLWNNCEHFASYCSTGRRKSPQVQRFLLASASAGVFLLSAAILKKPIRVRF